MTDLLDGLPVLFDFDLPLDGFVDGVDTEEPDADNSVLGMYDDHALPSPPRGLVASVASRTALVKVVGPLRREIRLKPVLMRGQDIRAVNRALSRAGIIMWRAGGLFPLVAGIGFKRNVMRFQRKHGLTVDGVYGNATHRALGRYFDAYGIKLYQDAKIGLSGAELQRQRWRSECLYLYHTRDRIHYTMGGARMSIVRRWLTWQAPFAEGDLYEDCSSIGKGLCKWVKLPDPNGFGYGTEAHPNVWGFTGTMAAHGVWVPARVESLRIGDALFTGHAPYTHVWYYIGGGLAMSHGKESDPRIVPWNYRPVALVRRYIKETT